MIKNRPANRQTPPRAARSLALTRATRERRGSEGGGEQQSCCRRLPQLPGHKLPGPGPQPVPKQPVS